MWRNWLKLAIATAAAPMLVLAVLLWAQEAQVVASGNTTQATPQGRSETSAPAISAIDGPSPTCYREAFGSGLCYITWNYFYVEASPSHYIISMTVRLDNNIRASHHGFFQTSMYVPGDMYGAGFLVTCGLPGAGGNPQLGVSHSFEIRAADSNGQNAFSAGSVNCPSDVVKRYFPSIRK